MRVALAGPGRLCRHTASNLARAGLEVTLWEGTRDKAQVLADEIGARAVGTPAELAAAVIWW